MVETQRDPLRGRRVLVVEDEYMIADDLARALEDRGADVIGPAGTIEDALELLDADRQIDGAVLDINLRGERALPLADALRARGVPFVFATGYDAWAIPDVYAAVPRVQKPVNTRLLGPPAVKNLTGSAGLPGTPWLGCSGVRAALLYS